MSGRAFAWVLAVLTAVLCVLVAPGPARAAQDPCESAALTGAEVSTSVRLEHEDRTYTKVLTELMVDVPGTWPSARDLLLSEDSRPYIEAMACLMGADQDDQRWYEWRPRKPVVTWKGGRVKVVDEAYGWVDWDRETEVGLWRVQPTDGQRWTVELRAPSALAGARWDKITVDPGRPGADRAEPEPKAGEGATALVWRPERGEKPSVTVTVRPPWQRSWAAWNSHPIGQAVDTLGTLLWVSTSSALLLAAVRRYRRRPSTATDTQLRTMDNLRAWAWLAIVLYGVAAADGVFGDMWAVAGYSFAALSAFLLLPTDSPRWIRRTAFVAVVSWAATTLMLILESGEIPLLPETQEVRLEMRTAFQTVGSLSLVALLLIGAVATAWRLATDGQLLPRSRRFPGRERKLRLRIAGPAILMTLLAIAVCVALVEQRNWQQASWLNDPVNPEFGTDHREDFEWAALASPTYVEDWLILQHGWLLTSIAVIAVLRAWRAPAALSPLHDRADGLLLLTFFALAVGLEYPDHLGNALLDFLWIPLYALALYGATAALAHRSVLAQPFEISRRPLSTVVGPETRRRLLEKARSYREIHAELRRLDQGLFGDIPPKRDALERKLRRLHNWTVNSAPGAAPDRLPAKVSVVDAALALGPRDDWWGNGVRGARFALVRGLPAAVLNTWAQWIRGEAWQNTISDIVGIPGLVGAFVSWMVMFTAAGFVLGTLWRVLPGRRGAVKALPVAGAFAAPAALDGLVGWVLHEGAANLALYVSTMLFVLTITAIALDLDTFAGERRYWQSRLGLLLSVYQMRYYSLQVAYLIGQIIAIITIWQFFAEPDVVPSGGDVPPTSNGGAGD